jgi:hypothetical protein
LSDPKAPGFCCSLLPWPTQNTLSYLVFGGPTVWPVLPCLPSLLLIFF